MKRLIAVAAISACLVASAAFARDAAIETPIHRMMDGFNKGDVAAVKALHVAAPTIVDEVAPFHWSGPAAFDTWLADLGKAEAAEGKTDGVVWFGDPVSEIVSGDRAYVVTPCSYTFKQKGKTLRETGLTSFVLVKQGTDWKIQSWTWGSPSATAIQ